MPADYCQLAKKLVKMLEKDEENGLIESACDKLRKGNIEAAITLFEARVVLATQHRDKYAEGFVNLGLGTCYLCQAGEDESNFRKAGDYFNRALTAFQEHDSKGEIIALIALGIVAEASGDFSEALAKYVLAEKQLREKRLGDDAADLQGVIRTRTQKAGDLLSEGQEGKTGQKKEPPGTEPPPTSFPEDLPLPEQLKLRRVPVLGDIAAGPLMLAEENIEEHILVDEARARNSDFALKVKGDSMVGVGIHSGDYVFVRQQQTADNGDIVVAMVIDKLDEATLKRYYYDGENIFLWSETAEGKQESLKIPKENAHTLTILGKVVGWAAL